MSDLAPDQETKPQRRRIGEPPKPPTKTTTGLQDESGEPPRKDSPLMEMVTVVTNAQTTWFELTVLNGGGRRLKRESLELSLDRNILLLGKLVPQMRGEDLEIVTRTLRYIREYRFHHPRSDASDCEQAEQVQKVLDEIREV